MSTGGARLIWTESDWCYALDDLVSALGNYFADAGQGSLALFIFAVQTSPHGSHADAVLVAKRRSFLSSSIGRLYRVLRYDQLLNVFNEISDLGFCSLIGIPEKEEARLAAAVSKGRFHVGYEDTCCLPELLGPRTPFFELAIYTSSCSFWISFSPECPEGLRRILGEARERLPKLAGG